MIATPVRFTHRGQQWSDRVAARQAVRYDIRFDPERGGWYLDASWKTTPEPAPTLEQLRAGRVLGVDLNADHLACCVLDASGNLVGDPILIEVCTQGLTTSRRDGRLRAAITGLLDQAEHRGCAAIVVENLDFADTRATGRETLVAASGGKRLRRTVAAIPTGGFRYPAHRDGRPAWHRRDRGGCGLHQPLGEPTLGKAPLQQQTSDPATMTRHHGAAAAIGRRGLGLAIRRRPAGLRSGQRTAADTPPDRPDRHPRTTPGCRSSGPPTRTPRGVPVHRRTPTHRGQDRSGRTGIAPAH